MCVWGVGEALRPGCGACVSVSVFQGICAALRWGRWCTRSELIHVALLRVLQEYQVIVPCCLDSGLVAVGGSQGTRARGPHNLG